MKIGVLGSGMVGKVLAQGFSNHSYEVMIGSRDKKKLEVWKDESGYKGLVGSFEETSNFGDLIILSVKGAKAIEAINLSGIDNFKGKIVIDTTNPIDDTKQPENGVIKFFTNSEQSLMEQLQSYVPEAKFVKAFNSVGAILMVNPDFGDIKPTMVICGNDDNARNEVTKILEKFGWEVEDMGKANAAGTIENLCILWCIPGFLRNEWSHAFKILKK
ncbi:MAG: DNA-binding protein [Ignavibacteria bacterium GWB2_35_12]|nr:MAG: DNA-binding protein [Ignavibacteria bacterium GWB2_35_12]OGU90458.1 MAG: DNA-binding protein [Ignavibacteria bacterium RIFOXYA2_FULL_35_10]OGV20584.1 MAG: DNA-binding protein [Ignavibacteria bacterium RIFOXYC2_FULL_35_21]